MPITKRDIVKSESIYVGHLAGVSSMTKRFILRFPVGTKIKSLKYVFLIEDGRWWTMVGAEVSMQPCEHFDLGAGCTAQLIAYLRGRKVFPEFIPHIGSKYSEEDIERLTYVDGTANEIKIDWFKTGFGNAGAYEVTFSLWVEVDADQPVEEWIVTTVTPGVERTEVEGLEMQSEIFGGMMQFMFFFMMMGMMMSIMAGIMGAFGRS